MDKLSFKRKTAKTDPKMVGEEREYVLAETIINGRPFLEYIGGIEKEHEYDYNLAKTLCFELTGESGSYSYWSKEHGWTHGSPDGWPGKNNAALLCCGVCFCERDNPLVFAFEETEAAVNWSGFHNDQTKRNYIELPVFRFEKEQYKAALEQLKKIAQAKMP